MMNKIILKSIVITTFLWCSVVAFAVEKPSPIKVACVGDSITFGFGIKDRKRQSYPAQLAVALGDGWSVRNFGRNGCTALKKGHAPYWKAPEYKTALAFNPDIVIIKLGSNDSRPRNWKQYKAEYIPDYVDLIRSFQELASKPTVWICYPAPVYPGLKEFSDAVIKNEVIPLIDEVAKQTGVKIIDIYSALSGKNKLFPDNLHPNAVGARLIAKTIETAITRDKPLSAE